MALQSSGVMTINDINEELGRASGTPLNFEDADVCDLVGKSPGDSIVFPNDFYGASAIFSATFSAATLIAGTAVGTTAQYVIWLYGHPYLISGLITETYSNDDLKLTISYQAPGYSQSPSLSGSNIILRVLGQDWNTVNSDEQGGGSSGINWTWYAANPPFVEGQQYTFEIEEG